MFEVSDDETVAVAVGALSFFTPAAVHAYHGAPEQAGASVGTMLGLTLLGTLVGGVTGYIIGDASCDDDVESDCDFAAFGPTIFGMLAGGVGGYIGNAIYDVTSNAAVPAPAPAAQSVSLRLWLAPTRAETANRPATAGAMSGLKVGATVHF